MDLPIILTYRCNSKCSMCNIWRNPSIPSEEISLETLAKLPDNLGAINLTGGEPTLRKDLVEIVDLLYPKTKKFEISSNGLLPEKIEPIIKKYPDIKIRFSLEGTEKTNNSIRGEKSGFRTKVDGLARLKELGGTDLGFAAVIQDDNVNDLVELFRFAEKNDYELSTSTLHNGFQFHKNDNFPYDRMRIARCIEDLIVEQLKTNSIKNWFRAYITLGLEKRILGSKRLLPCKHGYESVFIDPWGDVFACNVRPDLYMGNLGNQPWQEIVSGPRAQQVLEEVDKCQQNCWMAGVAKSAMRNPRFRKLPRFEPFAWVVRNKIQLLFGKNIDFQRYVDYPTTTDKLPMPNSPSYLNETVKKRIQTKNDQHYIQPGGYINQ
jgi:MoaA/NifB/PqqE/SkfB family radical SAM enzyme